MCLMSLVLVATLTAASHDPGRTEPGFVPLFNGRDLSGWKYLGPKAVWGVREEEPGVLQYVPEWVDKSVVLGGGEQLWTARDYTNFVLRFDFAMPSNGNNGVGIRMVPLKDSAYEGMCEIQLLDDGGRDYYDRNLNRDLNSPVAYCGSVYGVFASRRDNPHPGFAGGGSYVRLPGEWNAAEIAVSGSQIRVEVNGVTVTRGDVARFRGDGDTPDGKKHPGLHRTCGPIGLLGYVGHNVKFRNIRIRELE